MRDALLGLIGGYRLSQMIAVVAQAADCRSFARRSADGASARATDRQPPDALYRVLRTLAGVGVFAEDGPGLFRLTPMGELASK